MKKLTSLVLLVIIAACSSDSDSKFDGFEYAGQKFPLGHAWIMDEGSTPGLPHGELNFTNKYYTEDGDVGRNIASIRIDSPTVEEGTYNVVYCQLASDVIMQSGVIESMTVIIDSNSENGTRYTAGTVSINHISDTQIKLEYMLTRADGSEVTGQYSGAYTRTIF